MTTYFIGLFVVLMIVLIVVVVFFAVLERALKGGTKKVSEKNNTTSKNPPSEVPNEEPTATTKTVPTLKIYNSELADDLNEMLKSADNKGYERLQIENHINKESNIAKYLQSKNYHGFNFNDDHSTTEDTDEALTFTREDYKRIMALSNIDDKKSL